jgi:GNAT superfamily N-acetyltransferase
MGVEIKDITESNLIEIPHVCRCCLYWGLSEESEKTKIEPSKNERELEGKKKKWILQTLKEFGVCGKILFYQGVSVGYAEYGPSNRFLNIREYQSQPIGKIEENVVFLSCLYIANKDLRGKGLGKKLLDSITDDLKKRGYGVIETFARRDSANNPSGPVEFYLKNGFQIKNENDPEFPILRLNLSK